VIIILIYILIIFYVIQKCRFFEIEGLKKYEFQSVFFLKLIAAYFLYWIYTKYYNQRHIADIFKFYDDSKIISDAFFSKPKDFFCMILGLNYDNNYFESNYFINMNHWDTSYTTVLMNESRLIIKVNAILNILGFNSYGFNLISFLMIGYFGVLLIIKVVFNQIQVHGKRLFFWSIMLFPSIIFWTSGILKEPLTFFFIGLILHNLNSISRRKSKKIINYIFLIISAGFLFMIKFYVFACLIPSLFSYFVIKKNFYNPIKSCLYISLIILILIVLTSTFNSDYSPLLLLSKKQNDFILLAEFYRSGSYFRLPVIDNSIVNFILALPSGIFNGLFRPLPNDINKTIHLLPFVENIILYSTVLFMLVKFNLSLKKISIKTKQIIFPCLLFTLYLYTLTGLSTPVVGALVRYKIPGLLFLIISLNIIYDASKLRNRKK